MKKLSTAKISGALREATKLVPKRRNVTRWSSTMAMVDRYMKIKEFIPQLNIPIALKHELTVLLPSAMDEIALEAVQVKLLDFESVTKTLQFADGVPMNSVRSLFDAMIEKYPEATTQHLAADASIIDVVDFESAICKILDGDTSGLTISEKSVVRKFRRDVFEGGEEAPGVMNAASPPNFAKSILRQKRARLENISEYEELSWIPSTSNIVERLFSRAKLTLGSLRQSMTADTLEMVLMLHINSTLWSMLTAGAIVADPDNHFL